MPVVEYTLALNVHKSITLSQSYIQHTHTHMHKHWQWHGERFRLNTHLFFHSMVHITQPDHRPCSVCVCVCVRVCVCVSVSKGLQGIHVHGQLLTGRKSCTTALLLFVRQLLFFIPYFSFPFILFRWLAPCFSFLHPSLSLFLSLGFSLFLTHRRNKSAWFSLRNVPRCVVSVCQ